MFWVWVVMLGSNRIGIGANINALLCKSGFIGKWRMCCMFVFLEGKSGSDGGNAVVGGGFLGGGRGMNGM